MKNTKKLITVCLCLLISLTLISCSNTESTNVSNEPKPDEIINWVISPEEITVELGEEFQIEYSPKDKERPLFYYQKENGERETSDTRILRYGGDWDPNKGLINTDEPGFETFQAVALGTTYIFVEIGIDEKSTTNRCKVNVVEKKTDETQASTTKENKPNISVVLKNNLPQDVHWIGSRGDKYSTCTIREAKVNVTSEKITLDLLCEKTFDFKGGASMNCTMNWKLYDSSNVVVGSGMITKHNINLNEKFSESIYITNTSKLAPGTYTLAFTDVVM